MARFWVYCSPSIESAGGFIFCWNLACFDKELRVCEQCFVVIKGSWVARDRPEGILCLYASNDQSSRGFSSLLSPPLSLNGAAEILLFLVILMLSSLGMEVGVGGFDSGSEKLVSFVDLLGL